MQQLTKYIKLKQTDLDIEANDIMDNLKECKSQKTYNISSYLPREEEHYQHNTAWARLGTASELDTRYHEAWFV